MRMTQQEFDDHQARIGKPGRLLVRSEPKAKTPKVSAIEEMFAQQVLALCERRGIPAPIRNCPYEPDREFAGDLVWIATKYAFEVDGMVHRTKDRFHSDIEKHNFLLQRGWTVYRVSGAMVRDGRALVLAEQVLK